MTVNVRDARSAGGHGHQPPPGLIRTNHNCCNRSTADRLPMKIKKRCAVIAGKRGVVSFPSGFKPNTPQSCGSYIATVCQLTLVWYNRIVDSL